MQVEKMEPPTGNQIKSMSDLHIETIETVRDLLNLVNELAPDADYLTYFNYDSVVSRANVLLQHLGDAGVTNLLDVEQTQDDLPYINEYDHARELEDFDPVTFAEAKVK